MRLVIDTSTRQAIAAVIENNQVLWQANIAPTLQGASEILPQMQAAISAGAWSLEGIQEVVIGIGPGSYTGLRVGMAIAKMFVFVKQLGLAGVSSLRGFVPEQEGLFAVVVDARSGGAYILKGKKITDTEVQWFGESERIAWNEAAEHLAGYSLWLTPDKTSLTYSLETRLQANFTAITILETVIDPLRLSSEALHFTRDYKTVQLKY